MAFRSVLAVSLFAKLNNTAQRPEEQKDKYYQPLSYSVEQPVKQIIDLSVFDEKKVEWPVLTLTEPAEISSTSDIKFHEVELGDIQKENDEEEEKLGIGMHRRF